jgi:hypothetical protein
VGAKRNKIFNELSVVSARIVSRSTDRSFLQDVVQQTRLVDLAALLAVPAVLVGVFQLPVETRQQLVFDRGAPTVLTAYTSHFVHLNGVYLLGNVLTYLFVGLLSYLLCVLSDRRQLFWTATFALLAVFPFALSTMQLVFPRERLILGFSGINGGFFGLLCFSLFAFARANLSDALDERFAPVLLFVTVALIALVVLPERAWRVEIAVAALAIAALYVGVALSASGLPSCAAIREATANPGYFELAGGALGALLSYPFVGFGAVVLTENSVVDVYVHLLGYALAFITVFSFVIISDDT